MKLVQSLLASAILFSIASANAAICPSSGCDSNWLNVPGDFANPVNNFTMNLLGGWFNVDYHDTNGWHGISSSPQGGSTSINTIGNQINFTATQFNNIGTGQGTSTLNANLNHVIIGSADDFMGLPVTIYADGQATGTLVDNASSTQGQWTLNTHLYADWGDNLGIDLGLTPLSTDVSYSYNTFIHGSYIDSTATGVAMDYHTGLANFVGQGITLDGPFPGFRVTVGLQGQDPLTSPVPIPSAFLLLGSGLLGLIGMARRKAV